MYKVHQSAFTLIESLITLAIAAIIMGYALPSFDRIIQRSHATLCVNWLIGAIVYTRHNAIYKNTTVTLCPSSNGKECGNAWDAGLMAFSDSNKNARIDGKDRLLHRFISPTTGSTIKWRSFRRKQYLQMGSNGFTHHQNGNFVYCSKDQNPIYARQIIINMQGRARHSRDNNGDGIVEDRKGRALIC